MLSIRSVYLDCMRLIVITTCLSLPRPSVASAFTPSHEAIVSSTAHWTTCTVAGDDLSCFPPPRYHNRSQPPLKGIRKVVLGLNHTCALAEGGVTCWGYYDPTGDEESPSHLRNVFTIAAAGKTTCALMQAREETTSISCWGSSHPDARDHDRPTEVPPPLRNPREIAGGDMHLCAIDDSGVVCWGDQSYGQMDVPTGLVNPHSLVAGGNGTCVVDDEALKCWGNHSAILEVPSGIRNPREVAIGDDHACALTDSNVICWGRWEGASPLNVPPDLQNPRAIAAGYMSACALTDTGVRCWGSIGGDQGEAPHRIQLLFTLLAANLERIARNVDRVKKDFLLSIARADPREREEAFVHFVLLPFLSSIDSQWADAVLKPDLPLMSDRYIVRYSTRTLADFPRSDEFLRCGLRTAFAMLHAVQSELTSDSQQIISQTFLTAIAEKLAYDVLDVRDGQEIAALFAAHVDVLTEMRSMPRLVSFGRLTDELVRWMQ